MFRNTFMKFSARKPCRYRPTGVSWCRGTVAVTGYEDVRSPRALNPMQSPRAVPAASERTLLRTPFFTWSIGFCNLLLSTKNPP
jgi:hypothetical protein